MPSPLVTIAIPAYNHAMYVKDCLNSVRDEEYSNKEILIIDDGSYDETVACIREWVLENPGVRISLVARENKGLNATLNELIKKANGEYICFLASDDMLVNGGIYRRIAALENDRKKMAVIGDAKVIDEKGEITMESAIRDLYKGNKNNYTDDSSLLYSVVKEWSVPGPVLLVRKELYQLIGLYPENQFAEDINFYLKVVGLKLLTFINHPVALYRVHSTNTGGNPRYSKEISMTFIRAYMSNLRYYPLYLKIVIVKKLLGRVYLYLKASFFGSNV